MRLIVTALLCLLTGCSVAAAQSSNEVADTTYDANAGDGITSYRDDPERERILNDEAVLASWMRYLTCVDRASDAFARGPDTAADVVRGARAVCGAERVESVYALFHAGREGGWPSSYDEASAAISHREERVLDGQIGAVMVHRAGDRASTIHQPAARQ